MAKTAKYTVQLAKNFQQPTRWRNGIQFTRNVPQVLDLTPEEVEVFKDDRYMEIKKGAPKGKSEDVASSDSDTLPTDTDDTEANTTDEASTDDANSDEAGTSDEEETATSENETPEAGEDRKVKLLQKSRNAVNGIAKKLGIENAAELPNKEAVANAIIEAETANQGE